MYINTVSDVIFCQGSFLSSLEYLYFFILIHVALLSLKRCSGMVVYLKKKSKLSAILM